MKIEVLGAASPSWGNEAKTVINLKVKFSHLPDMWVDFSASPDDAAEHGRELFSRAKFEQYGPIAPYSGPSQGEIEARQFGLKREAKATRVEALIAPLERARRLGMATPHEEAELERLERYSVHLMRATPSNLIALRDF